MQNPFATADANNNISHLFVRWPVAMPDGTSVGGWTSYYDSKDSDHTNDYPPPVGSQAATLNKAWEDYVHANPTHLSREDWFKAIAGNKDNWNGSTLKDTLTVPAGAGGKSTLTLSDKVKPADITALDAAIPIGMEKDGPTVAPFKAAFSRLLSSPEDARIWLAVPENAQKALSVGAIGDASDVSKIKYSNADYDAKAAINNGWILDPKGNAYHMEKVGGDDYGATIPNVGYGFVVTGADGNPYFFVTKTTSGGAPVGTAVPLTENNTAPPSAKKTGNVSIPYLLSYGNDGTAADKTKIDGKYYMYAGSDYGRKA